MRVGGRRRLIDGDGDQGEACEYKTRKRRLIVRLFSRARAFDDASFARFSRAARFRHRRAARRLAACRAASGFYGFR